MVTIAKLRQAPAELSYIHTSAPAPHPLTPEKVFKALDKPKLQPQLSSALVLVLAKPKPHP